MPPSADMAEAVGAEAPCKMRVAIIGAGLSGLAAAKVFKQAGIEVTVFDSGKDVGGLWAETYDSTRLQNPKRTFSFSDFPMPDVYPDVPDHRQCLAYLKSYAKHFGLYEHMQLETKVLQIRQVGVGDWWHNRDSVSYEILTEKVNNPTSQTWLPFDFVMLAVGMHIGKPNLPRFPSGKGPEVFKGKVIHSRDYSRLKGEEAKELLRGKKVVVVGGSKTAFDLVVEAANANATEKDAPPSTVLYREPHWMLPYKIDGISFEDVVFTRAFECFSPRPKPSLADQLFQTLGAPLVWGFWKVFQAKVTSLHPYQKFDLLPKNSLFHDIWNARIIIIPDKLFPMLEAGQVKTKRMGDTPWYFTQNGISINGQEELDADVILLCTGYDGLSKFRELLPKKVDPDLVLYRATIHPELPNLAFLGSYDCLSQVYFGEFGAHYALGVAQKRIRFAQKAEMEKEIEDWIRYRAMYGDSARAARSLNPQFINFFDRMCEDLGWDRKRKGGLKESFQAYFMKDWRPEMERVGKAIEHRGK